MIIRRLLLLIIMQVLICQLAEVPAMAEEEVIEAIDIMKLYERAALVGKGEGTLRIGFVYHYDGESALINGFLWERRASGSSITLGMRYGLLRDLELSVNVPFVFREETEIVGGWSQQKSGEGLGDIDFGIRYEVLREGRPLWGEFLTPSVILGLSFKPDSGRSPYDALRADELPVGSGHRNVGLELIISRVIDPVLIHGMGQYVVVLEREHDNVRYDPGDIFNWSLGIGFAINPWVSIGGGVGGLVAGEKEIDDEEIVGSDRTPFHASLNLTYTITEKLRVTVETTMGINEKATDFVLGGAISYTF